MLVDGYVVGIVTSASGPSGGARAEPWTSVAGELAEWAPEIRDAVWPVGPLDNQGPVQGADLARDRATSSRPRPSGCSDGTTRSRAENGDAAPPSSALWTAVVLDASAFPNQTLAVLVPQHLERVPRPAEKTLSKMASDPGESARDWFGIQALPREPNLTLNTERLAALNPVLSRAAEFRDATQPGGGPIHLRAFLPHSSTCGPPTSSRPAVTRPRSATSSSMRLPTALPKTTRKHGAALFTANTPEPAAEVAARRRHAGYSADVVGKPGSLNDELNVAADVETLCDVLAAKDAIPPVSVGLFGRWGSGKSYFMALMQERMVALADAAKAASKEDTRARTAQTSPRSRSTPGTTWTRTSGPRWPCASSRDSRRRTKKARKTATEAGVLLAELNEREKKLTTIDVKIGKALADSRVEAAAKELGVDGEPQRALRTGRRSHRVSALRERRSTRAVRSSRLETASPRSDDGDGRRRRRARRAFGAAHSRTTPSWTASVRLGR